MQNASLHHPYYHAGTEGIPERHWEQQRASSGLGGAGQTEKQQDG